MTHTDTEYWIVVASKDHVENGIAEGVAQTCHGKASPLKQMQPNDFGIYYSSKQTLGKADNCQEFTVIGQGKDEDVYPFQMNADIYFFRRNIAFF